MTKYSYSRVDLFKRCPYHFKLKYLDHLTEMPRFNADNPLYLGHALHKGIELGEQAMIDDYLNSYPVMTDDIINELTKLKMLLPKVTKALEPFKDCDFKHEYKIDYGEFLGYADLILTAPDGTSTVIDFKYSNSVDNYLKSGQLHLYKVYLNLLGFNVQHLAYMFIPKTSIRQKKTEDLYEFRRRLVTTVDESEVKLVEVPYDETKVQDFLDTIDKIKDTTYFARNPHGDCFACNPRFKPDHLETINDIKGEIQMVMIPKNERRTKKIDLNPDVWLYADSYVGKTTFWDSFDDVLMVNTDGNTDNTSSPVIPLADEVTKEGRMTKRKFAWENFLEIIQDLEVENAEGYKTIVLDLMEDLRDDCRNYVMDKYDWEHESDGQYGKGWSMVTREFANAIKRLKMVGLQVVYISKELRSEITLKSGSTRTTFKPNIDDKTANFLTGTVDITMRAFVDDNDKHMLQLSKETNVFGGGRYEFKEDIIPLEKDAFLNALKDAQGTKSTERAKSTPEPEPEHKSEDTSKDVAEDTAEEKPKRKRRSRKSESSATVETPVEEQVDTTIPDDATPLDDEITPPGEKSTTEEKSEEKPRRPRRKRRSSTTED